LIGEIGEGPLEWRSMVHISTTKEGVGESEKFRHSPDRKIFSGRLNKYLSLPWLFVLSIDWVRLTVVAVGWGVLSLLHPLLFRCAALECS